ncbi:ParA family protein [Nocardioides panacisoli]|uniref:ParA family protein n=1 Tax=Nocardioides panacisoli TaxID=627624 RepID=UPI001C638B26|nr:ParA family protein [Nocardioides panacisoli]QYJ04268.1 ParA family protein [Nocardioides panacisoli]
MQIVASYSIKGGVGKTTTCANLAWLAASEGRRVLLWDLDPQGGATYLFRVRAKVKGGGEALVSGKRDLLQAVKASDYENLDLLPADFSYRNLDLLLDAQKKPTKRLSRLLAEMADEYDVVFLDCAPSVSLVSESIVRAADLVLAPILPAPLSVRTLEQLRDFIDDTKGSSPALLGFLSMVDRRRKLHKDLVASLPEEYDDIATTAIPAASAVEQMGVRRAPIVSWAPTAAASKAYRALWDEARAALP